MDKETKQDLLTIALLMKKAREQEMSMSKANEAQEQLHEKYESMGIHPTEFHVIA